MKPDFETQLFYLLAKFFYILELEIDIALRQLRIYYLKINLELLRSIPSSWFLWWFGLVYDQCCQLKDKRCFHPPCCHPEWRPQWNWKNPSEG